MTKREFVNHVWAHAPQSDVPHPRLVLAAAILGFLGVALGASGAHALNLTGDRLETWRTAGQYHVAHALAALLAALFGMPRAGWLFVAGAVLFSGSLYGLALGGPRLLGPVTPLGGVCFLAGWLVMAYGAVRTKGV